MLNFCSLALFIPLFAQLIIVCLVIYRLHVDTTLFPFHDCSLTLHLQLHCLYLNASFPLSFNFINIWANQPMNHFPFLCGNLRVPSQPFHPHCPPDGEGTDPSSLVRSVTSVAHLGVSHGASGCVCASPPCQGSRACQLLHLQRAAAADAAHLQVNVFWGGVVSAHRWVKQASRPIRVEQIRRLSTLQKSVRAAASVSRMMLSNCVLLWKSCYCFLWLSVSGRRIEKRRPGQWVQNLLAVWAPSPVHRNNQGHVTTHTHTHTVIISSSFLSSCKLLTSSMCKCV